MTDIIKAPFTPEQVESINEYQHSGVGHPFTCAECRDDRGTRFLVDDDGNIQRVTDEQEMSWSLPERTMLFEHGRILLRERELVATLQGMICPTCCDVQTWVHDFMANGAWRGQMRLLKTLFGGSRA